MSLLTYLKLAKDNIHNSPNIIKGFVNSQVGNLYLSNFEKEIITDRLSICNSCPHMNRNVPYDKLPEDSRGRPEPHCTTCGCIIEFKTAAFGESCPRGFWSSFSEEELKQINELLEKQKLDNGKETTTTDNG